MTFFRRSPTKVEIYFKFEKYVYINVSDLNASHLTLKLIQNSFKK